MKKRLAILLCVLFLLSWTHAETFSPTSAHTMLSDAHPRAASVENGLSLRFRDETILLDFDSDPYYSYVENGTVCASFYVETTDSLYELYLLFPETVISGQTITPSSMMQAEQYDSGIVLSHISDDEDLYCLAGQDEYGAYPDASDYSIHFESITLHENTVDYVGTFECTLVPIDEYFSILPGSYECSGTFSFTFDVSQSASPVLPDFGDEAEDPSSTPSLPTAPGLVTPSNAQKI